MAYFTYILYSERGNRYYIGSSGDPDRRLAFHNTKEKGFTSRYRPWKLVYTKEFESRELAVTFEKKIKSWKSRPSILKLVDGETIPG